MCASISNKKGLAVWGTGLHKNGFLYRAFFFVKDFEEADFADEAICFGILDFDT